MTDLLRTTGAHFSPCRTWRMRLWRIWDPTLPLLAKFRDEMQRVDHCRTRGRAPDPQATDW